AWNIHKGASDPNYPAKCNKYDEETDNASAKAFPSGVVTDTFPGGMLHSADWDSEFLDYWKINHPADVVGGVVQLPSIASTTHPTVDDAWPPSRYDVYRYEIEQQLRGAPGDPNPTGHRAPNGERGDPQCYTGPAL